MRALAATLFAIPFLAVVACGSSTPAQPTAPTATAPYGAYPPGYPPPGYPPPGAPPPGYATAPAPGYPPPGAPPAGPTPAPGGAQLSTPGMLALPCQSDASCGLHHCNTQYGKCTFPCQLPTDCLSNNCMMGVCLRGTGQ